MSPSEASYLQHRLQNLQDRLSYHRAIWHLIGGLLISAGCWLEFGFGYALISFGASCVLFRITLDHVDSDVHLSTVVDNDPVEL